MLRHSAACKVKQFYINNKKQVQIIQITNFQCLNQKSTYFNKILFCFDTKFNYRLKFNTVIRFIVGQRFSLFFILIGANTSEWYFLSQNIVHHKLKHDQLKLLIIPQFHS